MHAMNTSDAAPTPASERWPRLMRRYQAHSPDAGRNASREVLARPATPHSSPNSSQGRSPWRSSSSRVSQKISASSSAARLVSHTQRVHQYMTNGVSAHSQAVHTATFSLKHRLAIRKMGAQVSAEKRLLIVSRTSAEARV